MVAPNEKLAQSLTVLHNRQIENRHIFRSAEFSREDRERLVRHGWLVNPIVKGWLMASEPRRPGTRFDALALCRVLGVLRPDTVHASFWFDQWHLSPDLSLTLHAEKLNGAAPSHRTCCRCAKPSDRLCRLRHRCSISEVLGRLAPDDLCFKDGLRLFTADAALVARARARFFREPPR